MKAAARGSAGRRQRRHGRNRNERKHSFPKHLILLVQNSSRQNAPPSFWFLTAGKTWSAGQPFASFTLNGRPPVSGK
jgi:hypothetical protein